MSSVTRPRYSASSVKTSAYSDTETLYPQIPEMEAISALARAFYVLIIITAIFFIVMLGTVIALLVSFNNILLYIAVSSGLAFALLLLLTVLIVGLKQFERTQKQKGLSKGSL